MFNIDTYFAKYDYESIIDEILANNKVEKDDDHIKRHRVELKKKIEDVTRKLKESDLLRDLPVLDNDFSSYVILSNTNIVESEKRDKFKQFLAKTITKNFTDKIRDVVFPYSDEDIPNLNGSGFIIFKLDSYEEAKLAASAMHGVNIVKTHKVNATTFMEYERVINMKDEYTPKEYFSLENLIKWEESNFIEMIYLHYNEKVIVGKIHFLRKEFSIMNTINIPENSEIKWSPQGKYLIINTGEKVSFYGGENMELVFELKNSVKNYCLSSDENHLISFTGMSDKDLNKENVFIWDLLGEELIRGFTINKEEKFENFKWSPTGKFFGRIKKDILIIYESPKMQIIADVNGVRQPIKENVKDFHWFPNKNIIITVTEKRNKKGNLDESILSFYEIPSRRDFGNSVFSGLEIYSLEWHKSNNILAVICKSQEKVPSWTIRIFEFDDKRLNYRSSTTNLNNDFPYYTLTAKWISNDLFIVPKYKEGNLDTLNVYPYKLNKVSLKIDAWPAEKVLKSLKYSHFIPSSDGAHFVLGCLDPNNRNSYGRVDLYSIFDNTINYCKSFDFQNTLSNLVWDFGGRLFTAEFFFKGNEGFKLFDSLGNLIYDNRETNIQKINWRPRHLPVLERAVVEEEIKKNFKAIGKVYEEEDSEFLSEIDKYKRAARKKVRDEFMAVVNTRRELWEISKPVRDALYVEPEPVYVEVDVVREEIISTFEEIISNE